MNRLSRTNTVLLVTFLVLVWGVSWPIYKIALAYTPPLLFAGMRTLFGGLLLALLLFPKRKQIRWEQNWPIYAISSIFNVALFYGLQTVGLRYLPSGLFSVIVYLQPVLVGLLAWKWLGERMNALKLTGLLVGFAGVATVSSGGISGHIAVVGIVLALLTAADWAIGAVYVKKAATDVDPIWLAAFQCILGGILLTAVGSGSEQWSDIVWNVPYMAGLLFGIVLGISASWVVYFTLVYSGDASKVASITFLVPVVSVFAGTWFLHEPFPLSLWTGLFLIGISIYLINRPLPQSRPAPAAYSRKAG